MNKFIKLTRAKSGKAVYVSVSNILYFDALESSVTSIKFGTEKEYSAIGVTETPEEILGLIKQSND